MEKYVPTETDIAWTRNLVATLKEGGTWGWPDAGAVLRHEKSKRRFVEIEPGAGDSMNRLEANLRAVGYTLVRHDDFYEAVVFSSIVDTAEQFLKEVVFFIWHAERMDRLLLLAALGSTIGFAEKHAKQKEEEKQPWPLAIVALDALAAVDPESFKAAFRAVGAKLIEHVASLQEEGLGHDAAVRSANALDRIAARFIARGEHLLRASR